MIELFSIILYQFYFPLVALRTQNIEIMESLRPKEIRSLANVRKKFSQNHLSRTPDLWKKISQFSMYSAFQMYKGGHTLECII